MTDLEREMASLSRQIARFEARLGEVSGELAEADYLMAPFLHRYQREVLDHHVELVETWRQIADRRLLQGDKSARGAGEVETPLSRLVSSETYVPVQEQYERVWKGRRPPRAEDLWDNTGLSPATEELQELYTKVISHLHPGLADTSEEYARRLPLMAQVDRAFIRRDRASLQAMVDAYENRSRMPAIVDDAAVAERRRHAFRLEKLIVRLEGRLYEMQHGDAAKVMAYAVHAREQGLDLLEDLQRALQRELQDAKRELSQLESEA